jgi:hypothetical protein
MIAAEPQGTEGAIYHAQLLPPADRPIKASPYRFLP